MTLQEAKALFKEILLRRRPKNPPDTSAITTAPTANQASSAAQTALATSQDATQTGTCTYAIDGQTFTLTDVTQAECDTLPGSSFTPSRQRDG
jgi:hypothetical protein